MTHHYTTPAAIRRMRQRSELRAICPDTLDAVWRDVAQLLKDGAADLRETRVPSFSDSDVRRMIRDEDPTEAPDYAPNCSRCVANLRWYPDTKPQHSRHVGNDWNVIQP